MNTNTGNANTRKQEEDMLNWLRTHKGITRYVAMSHLRIANPPEIIRRLKMRGHTIQGDWVTKENTYGEIKRFKRYYLIKEAEA